MSIKDLSRRNFLQKTSALGAIGALGMAPMLKSCGKLSAEELGLPPLLDRAPSGKKLSAGLIGCGHRGTGALMNWLSTGPAVEVGALADVFGEKVESVRERLRGYEIELEDDRCFSGLDAYERLMESDVDVVILATPPYFRPAHFKLAIEKKKHVFMEKPVAVDPVGIRSVIATGRKAQTLGLNVVTGTQRRHQRDYIATYEKIANGAIGKIVAAKAFWNQEHVWFRRRQEGWSDMEYMLRNWNNFIWLCGDHILDTHIHNIELRTGQGAQIVRSAGGFAQLMAKEDRYAQVKLPSGEVRMVLLNCQATIGQIGNVEHENKSLGKAGRSRWLGKRPKVRGVAMNPVDHPMGGGEGRSSGGRHPCTPWGKPTKGYKTRNKRKSDRLIVRKRGKR